MEKFSISYSVTLELGDGTSIQRKGEVVREAESLDDARNNFADEFYDTPENEIIDSDDIDLPLVDLMTMDIDAINEI